MEGSTTEDSRNEDCNIQDRECVRSRSSAGPDAGRPGTVPCVSNRPRAYGRLLLAVYVRWRTGLLVSSDWLHPVTRGGGGRLVGRSVRHSVVWG